MTRLAIAVVFAGSGGSGAMTAGAVFLRAAARAGYYGMMTELFGAQVRGGESAALVQVSTVPIQAQPDRYDLFVALDWEKVEQFAAEIPLDETSVILADPKAGPVPPGVAKSKGRVVALSMGDPSANRLEAALHGRRVNMFATGAVSALIGLPAGDVQAAIETIFAGRGEALTAANVKNAVVGAAAAASLSLDFRLDPPAAAARWLISGNQAVALGALRGGVRFVGCYPITPATDLVEWLAPHLRDLGGRLVLAEDELASINMTLGASFGGTPAMTVTAGPGFSLMVEALGLAVAAEVPVVLVDVMRAGPSTGIASKTEQSDINLAIYGAHGDAPRIVLAPMSVADCINTTEYAVYVAEAFQSPVIVLSDQALGQATTVIDPVEERPALLKRRVNGAPPAKPFKRYAIGPDPITPMPLPGTPGQEWVAEGLTHNEAGLPASGAGAHIAQIKKRARKIASYDPGKFWGESWGEGDVAVLAIGSTIGPAREAAQRLAAMGHRVRVIGLRVLSPLPLEPIAEALAGASRIIVVEQNQGGQLYHHLIGQKAIPVNAESVARSGPLPFLASEIASYVV
jgi:2-oxoglutarate/2-oxoacid ferredoxin oxidoreductase subunit alpha